MSSSIRKTTLITLQLFMIVLVISLAFNFAFTPKATIASSYEESNLSLEDNLTSLDTNGGSIDLSDPTGSGNDFDVTEFFESTTTAEDIRLFNASDTPPEVVVEAPTQSTKLVYYNLTITDCYTEGGFILPMMVLMNMQIYLGGDL